MKLKIFSIAFVLLLSVNSFAQAVGDGYALDINNIFMPMNNKGVLAEVTLPGSDPGGRFGGHVFLFCGGFFLSGYSDGQLWANAAAASSLVEDYLPGTIESGQFDPRVQLYVLNSQDEPFGQSWQDWSDAVDLGADFYDGDGDGQYNPVDFNNNGEWDPNEDRPDLIGDETVWCVYNDGLPSSQRRWNTVEPQGIEIRQTMFAYSGIPALQNMIFVRYRIKNTGSVADTLTDVYFGVWDDPDLGDYMDDIVGCDTALQGGFTYNDGPDTAYGNNPPVFFEGVLEGPAAYIPGVTFIDNNGNGVYEPGTDIPLDTAFVKCGQIIGVKIYPGARNQPLTSSIEYNNSGDPSLTSPNNANDARNYMLGYNRVGDILDPCSWIWGQVRGGVDCSEVNPFFWYSGDPVTDYGWINTLSTDKIQMQNVGPFTLPAGEESELISAYIVGQGTDALNSITAAKNISRTAENLYFWNFDTSMVVSVKDFSPENIPEEFKLSQNFPNPFNPTTKILYSVRKSSKVTIKVLDVLGQEIETLVNEEKPAGSYEITWNAANLPSGTYFYQMRTGNFVQTKKMILLK